MAITFYGNAINISLSVSLCSIFILILIDCLQFINNLHFFASFVICLLTSRRCGGGRRGGARGVGGESGVSYTFLGKWFVSIATRIGLCVCVFVCLCATLSTFFKCKPRKVLTRFWSFLLAPFPSIWLATLSATLKPQLSWIFRGSGLLCAFPRSFVKYWTDSRAFTAKLSRAPSIVCSVRFQQLLATIATVAASVFTGVCFGPNTFYCLPKFLWGFFAFPGTQFIFYIFSFFFGFGFGSLTATLWLWLRFDCGAALQANVCHLLHGNSTQNLATEKSLRRNLLLVLKFDFGFTLRTYK